jgi:hypothetical protein
VISPNVNLLDPAGTAGSVGAGIEEPHLERRCEILRKLGARGEELEELLAYNKPHYSSASLENPPALPLPDEPCVEAWTLYRRHVESAGSIVALSEYLPQLCFPIVEGISQTSEYKAATRRGLDPRQIAIASGLHLQEPEKCRISIHPTAAGQIPVLIAPHREDFKALVRALTKRNEPGRIPDSQGAVLIGGFNNWHRIRLLRQEFLELHPGTSDLEWQSHLKTHILTRTELYHDRFMLLTAGSYSGVGAAAVGMRPSEWDSHSMLIRCEHECAHYFTRRVLGSMQNRLHDELIADAYGLLRGTGRFKASLFLRFMGLELYPAYRPGGRLENYRGDPMLSDRAFALLQRMVVSVARNVEEFSLSRKSELEQDKGSASMLLALASLSLEILSASGAAAEIANKFDHYFASIVYEGR